MFHRCDKTKCISMMWKCDGEHDCEDGTDESPEECSSSFCAADKKFTCKVRGFHKFPKVFGIFRPPPPSPPPSTLTPFHLGNSSLHWYFSFQYWLFLCQMKELTKVQLFYLNSYDVIYWSVKKRHRESVCARIFVKNKRKCNKTYQQRGS